MTFILETTKHKVENNTLEKFRNVFISKFGKDKNEIGFEDFKKIVPSKDEFFVSRIFHMFDSDKSGTISVAEFCETIHEFSIEDNDSKMSLLFHIYDLNEDGKLYKENFIQVIGACMTESGIKLGKEQVNYLAGVLFEDGVQDGEKYMTLECFKQQLQRHEGLVENLSMMLNKWLVPTQHSAKDKKKGKNMRYFSSEYWQWNKTFLITVIAIIVMMLIITIERFMYFR